jgi:hypothetical protein
VSQLISAYIFSRLCDMRSALPSISYWECILP